MCKFMSSLSRSPEIIGVARPNKNLEMFLKPTKEGEFYRVRLLGFASKTGLRTDPHITRMVHSAWETDPNTGKKHLVKVVCPSHTPWVDIPKDQKSGACKVCSYVNQQWAIYNESGKTDKTASSTAFRLKHSFEAIVPVYVVNDPNYEKNNGKCKVIIFTDKDLYKEFRSCIEKQTRIAPVFNGEQAVDCLLYVGTEDQQRSNGSVWKKTVITNVKFTTKPKDRPNITSSLIDSFPFDETYFTETPQEEMDEFYKKFCAIENDDIPADDDIPVYKPAVKAPPKVQIPANDAAEDDADDDVPPDADDLLDDDDDSLKTDPDEAGLDVPSKKVVEKPAAPSDDGEDLLAELGI